MAEEDVGKEDEEEEEEEEEEEGTCAESLSLKAFNSLVHSLLM